MRYSQAHNRGVWETAHFSSCDSYGAQKRFCLPLFRPWASLNRMLVWSSLAVFYFIFSTSIGQYQFCFLYFLLIFQQTGRL